MKRIHVESVQNAPVISRNSTVTVGVFDGMHQGHLSVLNSTCEAGKLLNADKVVVTFDMHPENLLNGFRPEMILTFEHRLRLMERNGLDIAVVIPFDEKTKNTPADQFLERFLLHSLNMRAIVLGHDSAFGKNRECNHSYLSSRKKSLGFEVLRTPEITIQGDPISSTRIREAIGSGDLPLVEEMLGRELSYVGRVVPGDGRGRELGFPTANLDCGPAILPPFGVYAVRVLHNNVMRRGVMNIGSRPTFHGIQTEAAGTVEVHIPGYTSDLYGSNLEVFIFRKIRNEKRFKSVQELKDAIQRDIDSIGR